MPPTLNPPTPRKVRFARPAPGPWFSRRPALALVVIGVLYVAVFTLRVLAGTPVDAYSMLFVLPVALAATAFGRSPGVAAGLLAVVLIVAWSVIRDVTLGPSAWATRVIPILLLGYLLGSAMDRVRRAEADRRRMEIAALMHREAIEINDSLIQRMTAAKWALEAGQTESTERILTEAISDGQRLVSSLIRRAGMGQHTEPSSQSADVPQPHDPAAADGRPALPGA
jgi:hypothetical protein